MARTYNIKFPLTDNPTTNSFFQMNSITKNSYSSDLLLLLLTQKGERYYESQYGTNLLKFIFEPNDFLTASDIEEEIKSTVKLYIPALTINKVEFKWSTDNLTGGEVIGENQLNVIIDFTFQEDSFSEQGSLNISF